MAARIAYRQRSLETPKNRLRRLWRRVTAHPQAKVRHAYLVTVNGLELKRVVLPDSRITSQLAAVLERFREDDVLPALVAQYTSELWVEFVEGERIRPGEPGTAAAVARAFAVLYRADARQVPEAETGVHAELCRDLEFLREAGVLDRRLHHRVLAGAERLRPEKIWVGYDYMDAIVPNLLRRPDGRVCIIDFESVETDRPLGSGIAKAFIRWLEPEREPFLEALQREGVPDFLPALPFAELAFLASWMKRAVIRRRWKHVGPERFVRFADP